MSNASSHTSPSSADNRPKSALKKWVSYTLRFLVPVACSAILILWLFHKVDIHKIEDILSHNVTFGWVVVMMLITMLSHMIRGVRWGIQLRAAGITGVPFWALCCSIFGNYAINLLLPRMGEFWRALYISKRQDKPYTTVFGTVLGDRASDATMVLMLTALTMLVAAKPVEKFVKEYAFGAKIMDALASPVFWIGLVAVAAVIWGLLYFFRGTKVVEGCKRGCSNLWTGFKSLFHMKRWGLFLLLTFGIWTCYFLQIYVCFFSFSFTRDLVIMPGTAFGLIPALVAFVFSSLSMAIPSNGGLGPWNIAVMLGLAVYGIGQADGAAFSMLVWSCQALMLVMLGIFTVFYVMYDHHRQGRLAAALAASNGVKPDDDTVANASETLK